RHRLAGDVARVEDEEVARVARLIVDDRHHVAVVFGGVRTTRDEERLAGAVSRAAGAYVAAAALEGGLLGRGGDRQAGRCTLGAGGGEVAEAVLVAETALVDARELAAAVVERRGAHRAGAQVESPAVQLGRAVVVELPVPLGARGHELEVRVTCHV